jgi:aminoglycoside 6'-N-acetyltransferase
MAALYAFRPMTTKDLPRMRQWLAGPHVWEQYALVSGDLAEPAMDRYVVAAISATSSVMT